MAVAGARDGEVQVTTKPHASDLCGKHVHMSDEIIVPCELPAGHDGHEGHVHEDAIHQGWVMITWRSVEHQH